MACIAPGAFSFPCMKSFLRGTCADCTPSPAAEAAIEIGFPAGFAVVVRRWAV